jgi:hypothetical protein
MPTLKNVDNDGEEGEVGGWNEGKSPLFHSILPFQIPFAIEPSNAVG